METLLDVQSEIVSCERCPRLREHCRQVAQVKRRAYRDQEYWGRPVPSFGDPTARLLILGLAPGAHGSNRTGRMFTGDRSGDFLYRALFETGFANQPESRSRGDGLALRDAYISASAHCAPPDNKPRPDEIRACRGYLERELKLLAGLQVVVALGKIAFDVYLSILREQGILTQVSGFAFGHNRRHTTGPDRPLLIASYHPSQQNTQTGKLTAAMLAAVFGAAKEWISARPQRDAAPPSQAALRAGS
jgi:uracil-DNA glycosylase